MIKAFLIRYRLYLYGASLLAAAGSGYWLATKIHAADEVRQLKADIKTLSAENTKLSKAAADAALSSNKLQAKHREAQIELNKLRRSNANVDAYLSNPVPDELREHHHKNSNPQRVTRPVR